MARARNVKPSFFTNDKLAELPPLTRLLFVGLWTLADREGRLEDRPTKIKAEVLPYDKCAPDKMLGELARQGFILRYSVAGVACIQILAFRKHQNPHVKEAASTIPAPGDVHIKPERAPEIPERTGLIPDSLLLIPDSPFPKHLPNPDGLGVNGASLPLTLAADEPEAKGCPPCPHDLIVAAYHELLPGNPRVIDWHETRQAHLRARWRAQFVAGKFKTQAEGVARFRKILAYCGKSAFLTGQAPAKAGGRPFVATLEWLVDKANFTKTVEGAYADA